MLKPKKGAVLKKLLMPIITVVIMLLVMTVFGDMLFKLISLGGETQVQLQNSELAGQMTITSAFPEETTLRKRTVLSSDCKITFKKDMVQSTVESDEGNDEKYWNFHKSPTYPKHQWEKNQEVNEPPEEATGISTWSKLDNIRDDLDGNYFLKNDLDSNTSGYEDTAGSKANNGKGWQPIDGFTGSLYGQRKTISDLYIERPSEEDVGLFGETDGAYIKNIGLENLDIKGNKNVGGLVGNNKGGSSVEKSYTTGDVVGEKEKFTRAGGLVGKNGDATISSSYSSVNVKGDKNVGGLVGYNWGGVISKAYAKGSVEGYQRVGGLVGLNFEDISNSYAAGRVRGELVGGLAGGSTGNIQNSFWNLATTGAPLDEDDGAGEPLFVAEMTSRKTFEDEGWDFESIWYMPKETVKCGSVIEIKDGELDKVIKDYSGI